MAIQAYFLFVADYCLTFYFRNIGVSLFNKLKKLFYKLLHLYMMIDQDKIIDELANPENKSKPWMTARMLAKKIGLDESDASKVEECIYNYYTSFSKNEEAKEPVIRYSNLPSKKSLELLWGHLAFVGRRDLPDIHKVNVADDSLDVSQLADVFISHSFKDYKPVIQIAKMLQ